MSCDNDKAFKQFDDSIIYDGELSDLGRVVNLICQITMMWLMHTCPDDFEKIAICFEAV